MFLPSIEITPKSFVKDIAHADHRTVNVFNKYGIEFCCGAKWPLETISLMKGLDVNELVTELKSASRVIHIAPDLDFKSWSIDFLTEYITHVHHSFLRKFLPECWPLLNKFVDEHLKKYPYLYEVQSCFRRLHKGVIPHLDEEEKIIFPYIKQLDHARQSNDQYGRLLVKTLRKPVDIFMDKEHEIVLNLLQQLRVLTNNYTPPDKACTSHRVVWGKLRELDNDLIQHMYLENEILFPKAIIIEKELLDENGSRTT